MEEIKKRYKQYELARTRKLEKCRKEREYIIRMEKMRHRSQSLSPKGRRMQILEEPQLEVVLSSDEDQCASVTTLEDSTTPTPCEDVSTRNASSQETTDISSAATTSRGEDSSGEEGSAPVASSRTSKKSAKSASKSMPTSPFRRPSQLVPIPLTSPLFKLVDNPKIKTKLPAKDMKLLELMLRRREQEDKEAEERRRAHRAWDLERQKREQRAALRHTSSLKKPREKRWRDSQPLTSSSSCELLDSVSSRSSSKTPEEKMSAHMLSHLAEMQHCLEQASERQLKQTKKLHEFQREQEEGQRQRHWEMERAYRKQLEDRIRHKEAQFAERQRLMSSEKESTLRKSAEELEEKFEQVRLNQREMDQALDHWRQRVSDYLEATNLRARQRAQEQVQFRKRLAQQERLLRQAGHQQNLHRVEIEESERLHAMMERLREKDEKSRLHAQEKQFFIEQSRALAKATADLRDQLRLHPDRDIYLRRPHSNLSTSSSMSSCFVKRTKSNEDMLK